jgi:hypothetical protein
MSTGCNIPTAVNYDPNALTWDHSCQYLLKSTIPSGSICLLFEDTTEFEDRSFTASYSVKLGAWVFFHDYIPDYYLTTREKLFNVTNQKFYQHHEGAPGNYYDEVKPFFVDVAFRTTDNIELLLETVNWVSSLLLDKSDNNSRDSEWNTLTHITVWNSQQHTGRIAISQLFQNLQYDTSRNTNGQWSFNDFRNILASRGSQFIYDLFQDYSLDPATIGNKPWYELDLLQDKYFIVRFEFDNTIEKTLILHDTTIQAKKAHR